MHPSDEQISIKHIAAVVMIGVLTRDYDFAASPPDEEIDSTYPIHQRNHVNCCGIIGKLMLKEIMRKGEGQLSRVFFCQLLKSYLRLHSRAINLIDTQFVSLFNSVLFCLLFQ